MPPGQANQSRRLRMFPPSLKLSTRAHHFLSHDTDNRANVSPTFISATASSTIQEHCTEPSIDPTSNEDEVSLDLLDHSLEQITNTIR